MILSRAVAMLLALATTQAPDRYEVTGTIPVSLGPASRVLWVPADGNAGPGGCELSSPSTWRCHFPSGSRGVVVVAAGARLASFPIGIDDVGSPATIASWGRLVIVDSGGGTAEDLRDLHITAWKPERSTARQQTRRFRPIEDSAVQVMRLSNVAFWLTGEPVDHDASVLIESHAFGAKRLATLAIASDTPDVPFYTALTIPISIVGRVEDRSSQNVEDADVEIFEPLTIADPRDRPAGQEPMLIRRAKTRSSADGSFVFEGLEIGPWQVVATHPSWGRGTAPVIVAGEPLVIRLKPPARVTGRVLQRGLPVLDARIRFVPDTAAWMASLDPRNHLVEDSYSGMDGRFSLALPPERAGTVQIIGPDGVSRRLALPVIGGDEIALGDISLPRPIRAFVRVSDPLPCDVFATGPLGTLGLTIVRATRSATVYEFALPEPGTWALNAACGGLAYSIDPPVIAVAPGAAEPTYHAHVVRPAPDQ
jgi:hypothetical protein